MFWSAIDWVGSNPSAVLTVLALGTRVLSRLTHWVRSSSSQRNGERPEEAGPRG